MSQKPSDLLFGDLWSYAPAPESASHARFEKRLGHFIGGAFEAGDNPFPVLNPATEEVIAEAPAADAATVDRAGGSFSKCSS